MGLSIVGAVSGKNPVKGLISAVFGLFIASIGMDSFTAVPRFTFGVFRLSEGLDLIPVLVGLLAVSEVFRQIFTGEVFDIIKEKVKMTYPTLKEIKQVTPIVLMCGAMGSIVGALPGAGATIASGLGYSEAKMLSKNSEPFGTGDIRGVAAPESANNGVPAGGLIPLLALGVPGSNSTAILMAGFSLAGISVGPMLFVNKPQIPYKLMACMLVAQIILLFVGLLILKPCVYITSVHKVYLTSGILLLAFIGAFSTTNDIYSVILVLIFGIIGFFMKRYGFAPPATVLGLVLGELVEDNLRRSLQLSHGTFGIFFQGSINIVLIIFTIIGIFFPYITKQISVRAKSKTN
jgi:putative tricarboxylic transport membrane protein